ncbi:hypothetical protein ABBQ38_011716 [Trebouxia sp. C0009 RCD-2024]
MSVQGLWTDGGLAFTVALDQKLRCWQLQHDTLVHRHRNNSRTQPTLTCVDEELTAGHATAIPASDEHPALGTVSGVPEMYQGPQGSAVTVCLREDAVTQVLEPAALDAVYSSVDQAYHVLVAGRGTQLLNMSI